MNNSQIQFQRQTRNPLQSIENSRKIKRRRSLSMDDMKHQIKDIFNQKENQKLNSYGQINKTRAQGKLKKTFKQSSQTQIQQSQISVKNNEKENLIKKLRNALKEACDDNEILRLKVTQLEALLSAAEDEIEIRDKAILEMTKVFKQKYQTNQKN